MVIKIRLYTWHDTDLIALLDAGYPLTKMMRKALIAYAHEKELHYLADEIIPFKAKGIRSSVIQVTIPDSDTVTCGVLTHIQKGLRAAFCKYVLRNAFIKQNVTIFFTDVSYSRLQERDISYLPIELLNNVVFLSSLEKRKRQLKIFKEEEDLGRQQPVGKFNIKRNKNRYTDKDTGTPKDKPVPPAVKEETESETTKKKIQTPETHIVEAPAAAAEETTVTNDFSYTEKPMSASDARPADDTLELLNMFDNL